MYKEKQTRIVAIAIISLLVIVGINYFIPGKTLWNSEQKEITTEHIDSSKEILPEEMFSFLTENDSLTICLNSMADFYYDSKDSIVSDSVIPGNTTHYEFEWDPNEGNWRMLSRYSFRTNSNGLLMVSIDEDYLSYNNSWEQTRCDSFFYDDNGEFIMQKSLNGDVEKYDCYEDGRVKIRIHIMPQNRDTKTIELKDKKTGKVIKKQEFIGNSLEDEWTLEKENEIIYADNNTMTKSFTKDYGEKELKYSGYNIENKINDSLLINTVYTIDSSGIEVLRDSFIHIIKKDKSKFNKHLSFSKEQKLMNEDIDSSYYDADSNSYIYTKSANYSSGYGFISFSIVDSLNRLKYNKSQHWNNDSTLLNNFEKFGYFSPKSNISVKYEIKPTGDLEVRIRDGIDIELVIDQFNSCKTSLYWDEEDKCYNLFSITLRKLNKSGEVIESIDIE